MAQKASKRYREALKVSDLETHYPLEEGVTHLLKMPKVKFDETVELSIHLAVDAKQSDQMVRGTVSLPHGSGKDVTVIVFTEKPEEALAAGAKFAGLEDLLKKVEDGWMDFDVAISTPSAMKEVRKLARVLGPRGLMPNPKSGTVTDDIAAGVKEVMAGRVEFKMDKGSNLAVIIGKRSFTGDQLIDNARKAMEAIFAAKPESFKGPYIKTIAISSTMSPSVTLDTKAITAAA